MAKAYKRLRRQRRSDVSKTRATWNHPNDPSREKKEIVHSISAREPLTATDQATGMSRHKECVYRTEVWLQYELFCLMLN